MYHRDTGGNEEKLASFACTAQPVRATCCTMLDYTFQMGTALLACLVACTLHQLQDCKVNCCALKDVACGGPMCALAYETTVKCHCIHDVAFAGLWTLVAMKGYSFHHTSTQATNDWQAG